MDERKFKYVGTRPIRPDGVDKVTGRANYGADIDMPGMLHGVVLRSPYARARIRSIDTRAAAEHPGVKAVIVGSDLPDLPSDLMGGPENHYKLAELSRNCLAREAALYHGHAVAALAATTLEAAHEALEKIVVDYEVLEPVLTIERAIAADAPIIHDHVRTGGMRGDLPDGPTNIAMRIEFARGDTEAGFAEADVIVEREFTTPWAHQGYIEPHACAARVGEDGEVFLYGSSQGAFLMRDLVTSMLQLEPGKVKAVPAEIGGGFGGKTTVYNEPLVVVLAAKAQRPVKMVMTREEVFRATGPTSASQMRFKMGAKRDGTITAATASIYMEAGAFAGSPAGAAAMCCFGPYKIPNFRIEAYDVLVNKLKSAAYRAPGAPMGAFGTESLVDEVAAKLGMDPIDLRLKNAVGKGDVNTLGMPFDEIGFVETLRAAKNHPHYKAPLAKNQGRGVASGYWFNGGMQSSATISIHPDGSAVVASGNPDIGGWRASMALITAEELGIPYEHVRPMVLDTDSVGYSDLTGGSRTTVVSGMAIIEASRQIIDELRARAATMWGVELDSVGWKDGAAVGLNGAGDNDPMPLAEIAAKLGATGGPINAEASVVPSSTGPSFGTHLCDIEVDAETGVSKIVRYTVVQDAGKAVHPSYVEGQMQGGASQGIGIALNEEYVFDDKGVLENPSFLDYRMPVASDLPMIDTVIVEVANPAHPYGARGVGEIPIVPPLAAVANAMSHAVGARMTDLPMSPGRVLDALDDAS